MTETSSTGGAYTEERLLAAVSAYEEHGSFRSAASAMGVSVRTLGRLLDRAEELGVGSEKLKEVRSSPQKVAVEDTQEGEGRVISAKGVKSLKRLLKEAKVSTDEWIVTKKVINKWDSVTKEGIKPLWQIKAWLERKPDWFTTPVKPVKPLRRRSVPTPSESKVSLIIPDSQHGYRRQDSGKLVPMHDRKACDLAVQAAQVLQPESIVLLGDMLDLAPWSLRWPVEPSLRDTTQPALVELHWWIASLRKAAPAAKIVYLEGNHEYRIHRALTEKLQEAVTLRPADDLEGTSILSVDRLLSLDKLDVEYIAPYGAAWWLWDKVKVHHGSVVRSKGGQTVATMLDNATYSQVVGHIHRREYASRVIESSTGTTTVSAMSPGCLCRVDGAVPHSAGRSFLDWQQALGLIYDVGGTVSMQVVPIDEGKMVLYGKTYEGVDHTELLRDSTGLPF